MRGRKIAASALASMVGYSPPKPVAVLTLNCASGMSKRQREQVAKWLRKQADALASDGGKYSDRFRARFLRS